MTLERNQLLNKHFPQNDTQLSYCVNYTELSFFAVSPAQHQTLSSQDESVPHNEAPSFTHSLISKGLEFYSQTVEPKLTKEHLDNFIVGTISFSTYYGLAPSVSQFDSSAFMKRAGVSIGFKLFNTFVNPALSQFVEAFTEVHINNAKYSYYSARCLLDIKYCDALKTLKNPLSYDPIDNPTLLQDFSQFDTTSYLKEVNQGLSKLSLPGLFTTGTVSATASEIKDFTYGMTGFDNYCKGDFCKNWISYYYKETLKSGIKSLISSAQEKQNADNLKPVESEAPQDQGSKIHINDVIHFETSPSLIVEASTNSTSVPMDIPQLSMSSLLNQIQPISTPDIIL